MEIRDILHGSVVVDSSELAVIDSPFFQRLREIKQLGFAEFSFPSATHNRYVHSVGALGTVTQAFDTIFGGPSAVAGRGPGRDMLALARKYPSAFARFRAVTRLAALLHDIGHGPLSHTTEFAMPPVKKLGLPACVHIKNKHRQATHEDYTLKILLDSALTPVLQTAGRAHGFGPEHVAALINPEVSTKDDFFTERTSFGHYDFRPILRQLISSEIDADRMDYLRRDSIHAGVSYGQFDFNWLVGNLTYHLSEGKCRLALQHRALYAFEDFLISRFHMFLMVYFHYKSVVYDSMLARYFEEAKDEYSLPTDIEKYCDATDTQLFTALQRSRNPWAKRIVDKHPYRMLLETHSGIPAGATALREQARLHAKIQRDLKARKITFLTATSTGELSKYFRTPGDPIFVRYDNHFSAPSFIPLERCTDLFQKYSEKRFITRLYVSPEDYGACSKHQERHRPLKYETTST